LDVGTGNCRNLLFFEDQKWEHIGFDVSFELLDNAITLEKNRIYHVNNDMKFLSLRNNFADFALCIATLHHLRNKRDAVKVLKNIRSTLKKIMLEKMEEGFKERDAERFDILSIQKIEK